MDKKQVILLVEDDANDELLTRRALEASKIANRLDVAHDGAEALDYLLGGEGHPPHALPEVVLLDLNLPKINGMEVLRRIRAHPRTCLLPVVILTSSSEEKDMAEGYHLGANSYVQKPVDFDQFIHAAQQLGLYWLVLNRAPPSSPP